ncbi:MAG: efflux RND transporter periplasmic adaptor subunit [Pseudomonadota bacterium]
MYTHAKSFLVLSALFLTACEPTAEVSEQPLRPVRYITVTDDNDARIRSFSGTSRSTQISRLSFKVSGTLVELPIEVGDRLSPGDLVARLDASSMDLEVQQTQASLVQAEANARNSLSNYERVKGLYENNNASRNDLDSARAQSESGNAQVRAAQKSLELARLNRSYTRLTAEQDCTVASVSVDLNENVNPGGEVARVNCGTGLEVELAIPDSLISAITPSLNVGIRFDSIANTTFPGTIREIGIAASSGAPTFPVIVSVDSNNQDLRAGLSADVTFAFPSTQQGDAHIIPLSAITNDGEQTFVFVAVAGGDDQATLSKRSITVGELTDSGIEVLQGLEDGDRVVTAGVSVVRDGQTVLLR